MHNRRAYIVIESCCGVICASMVVCTLIVHRNYTTGTRSQYYNADQFGLASMPPARLYVLVELFSRCNLLILIDLFG